MADNQPPTQLAPEAQDEIVVTVRYVGGQPMLAMQMRRVTYAENGIVLATPRTEPLTESAAIAWLLEIVKSASMRALMQAENQAALANPGGLQLAHH